MVSTNKPYITVSEYWDMDTGEKIKKRQAEKHYIKKNKIIKYKEDGSYNVKTIEWHCERSKQYTIWQ